MFHHHSQVIRYVDPFGFGNKIVLNTADGDVSRTTGGTYPVRTDTGLTRTYKHLFVRLIEASAGGLPATPCSGRLGKNQSGMDGVTSNRRVTRCKLIFTRVSKASSVKYGELGHEHCYGKGSALLTRINRIQNPVASRGLSTDYKVH